MYYAARAWKLSGVFVCGYVDTQLLTVDADVVVIAIAVFRKISLTELWILLVWTAVCVTFKSIP